MLKEAFMYLTGLGKDLADVEIIEIDGRTFTTKGLHEVEELRPTALTVNNLSGLCDYIKSDYDKLPPVLVQVASPTKVNVFTQHNRNKKRSHLLQAEALLPEIPFGKFLPVETFNILLQSCFVETDQRAQLLVVVGNIKEENVANVGDDGVSQQVTAKAGVATVAMVPVPNPVFLKPYRTFVDIEQPQSRFVFRMQSGPQAALIEADGGAWKLDTIHSIRNFLSESLSDLIQSKHVTIIA